MTNQFMHGPVAAIAQITLAGVKYVGKVESSFSAAMERLYAAHVEKGQMRLAPTSRFDGYSPNGKAHLSGPVDWHGQGREG